MCVTPKHSGFKLETLHRNCTSLCFLMYSSRDVLLCIYVKLCLYLSIKERATKGTLIRVAVSIRL